MAYEFVKKYGNSMRIIFPKIENVEFVK